MQDLHADSLSSPSFTSLCRQSLHPESIRHAKFARDQVMSLVPFPGTTAAAKQHYPTRIQVPGLEFGTPNLSNSRSIRLHTLTMKTFGFNFVFLLGALQALPKPLASTSSFYRVRFRRSQNLRLQLRLFIGCASGTPDGSSPRAYDRLRSSRT